MSTVSIILKGRAGLALLLLLGAYAGCQRGDDSEGEATEAQTDRPAPPRAVLSFPQSLRTDDASVNEFVAHSMRTCANGDYDSFRLLWSAREEPLERREYERGWKAVQEVTIRALERVRLAPDEKRGETESRTVYAVYADVRLDPEQTPAQQETERHVVLVVLREHDQWRLAKAPQSLRSWLHDKIRAPDESHTPQENGSG